MGERYHCQYIIGIRDTQRKSEEKLWIEKLDKNIRYVMGIPARTDEDYYRLLRDGQRQSVALGYIGNMKNWKKQEYELRRREMLSNKRRANAFGDPYAGGG